MNYFTLSGLLHYTQIATQPGITLLQKCIVSTHTRTVVISCTAYMNRRIIEVIYTGLYPLCGCSVHGRTLKCCQRLGLVCIHYCSTRRTFYYPYTTRTTDQPTLNRNQCDPDRGAHFAPCPLYTAVGSLCRIWSTCDECAYKSALGCTLFFPLAKAFRRRTPRFFDAYLQTIASSQTNGYTRMHARVCFIMNLFKNQIHIPPIAMLFW